MEISSGKSKILVNIIKPGPSTNIQMNGQTPEEVDQFKYLGSTQIGLRQTWVAQVQRCVTKDDWAMKKLVIGRLAQPE